jgi:hypothetical protein
MDAYEAKQKALIADFFRGRGSLLPAELTPEILRQAVIDLLNMLEGKAEVSPQFSPLVIHISVFSQLITRALYTGSYADSHSCLQDCTYSKPYISCAGRSSNLLFVRVWYARSKARKLQPRCLAHVSHAKCKLCVTRICQSILGYSRVPLQLVLTVV